MVNKSNKKQIVFFVSFLIVIAFLYSIRPITQKYGDKSIGIVTSVGGSALKGGKSKRINYVLGNKVYETTSGQYFQIGDKVEVSYFKSLLRLKEGIVGEKVNGLHDEFLVFSESVPGYVKVVSVYENNKLTKKINVTKNKNFGIWVSDRSEVTIKYDKDIPCKFQTHQEPYHFRELN